MESLEDLRDISSKITTSRIQGQTNVDTEMVKINKSTNKEPPKSKEELESTNVDSTSTSSCNDTEGSDTSASSQSTTEVNEDTFQADSDSLSSNEQQRHNIDDSPCRFDCNESTAIDRQDEDGLLNFASEIKKLLEKKKDVDIFSVFSKVVPQLDEG